MVGSTAGLLVLAAASMSCGGATPAESLRPKDQTYADAMGEGSTTCREVESAGEPLVVDWKPEERGDLEVLMHESVAVVSYSCRGLKVLKDCRVDGNYGFIGMSKKEQLVRLENQDEVRANLPLAGAGIAADIGAEMQRGGTLDIALVLIGKKRTTWPKVAIDELKGECSGATHFVRGVTVGAFVMETGSKAEARTAAQVFGAGATGASASAKRVRNQDGDPSDCTKALPDSTSPPPQCQALLRLELKAIVPRVAADAQKAEPASASPEVVATESSCPKGLVWVDGKCAAPSSASSFQCDPKKGQECDEQCKKGHAGSCDAAGAAYASGTSGLQKDDAKARELFAKSCDGGDAKGCVNYGVFQSQGRGGAKDAAGATKSFERGCTNGEAAACGHVAMAHQTGDGAPKDEARVATFFQKGCDGGDDSSCSALAKMTLDGAGVSKDPAKAAALFKRACDGGGAESCADQGRLELGQGGNPDMAKRAFERGCNGRAAVACASLKVLYGDARPFVPPPMAAGDEGKACNAGASRNCAAAGVLNLATGNKPIAGPQIERACTAGDPLACAIKKKK